MKPPFPPTPPANLLGSAPPVLGAAEPAALEASVVSQHGPVGCT